MKTEDSTIHEKIVNRSIFGKNMDKKYLLPFLLMVYDIGLYIVAT